MLQYVQLAVHLTILSFFQVNQTSERPLIKQFVKGVFNVKPPTSRCTFTWDIKKVSNYMNQLLANEELSMKLLCGERINSLATFSVALIQLTMTECTFIPCKLLKHSRPGYVHRPVTYKNYPQNIKLCPVRLIKAKQFTPKRHINQQPFYYIQKTY